MLALIIHARCPETLYIIDLYDLTYHVLHVATYILLHNAFTCCIRHQELTANKNVL